MSIEQVVQAWKNDENKLDANIAENPVGQEMTNDELEEIVGGMGCLFSCDADWTCSLGCFLVGTGIV